MVNDIFIHNCILDFGSSSNIMTKKIMEQLNLKVTIVCAMDSREVQVVGIILGFLVKLDKYLHIHLNMDILVIDVLDKWGMLLSRKWAADLGRSIQMV